MLATAPLLSHDRCSDATKAPSAEGASVLNPPAGGRSVDVACGGRPEVRAEHQERGAVPLGRRAVVVDGDLLVAPADVRQVGRVLAGVPGAGDGSVDTP